MLSLFMDPAYSSEQKDAIQLIGLGIFSALVFGNFIYILYVSISDCILNRKKKRMEALRKKYQ